MTPERIDRATKIQSRRDFLRFVAIGASASLFTACSPTPTATPTASPATMQSTQPAASPSAPLAPSPSSSPPASKPAASAETFDQSAVAAFYGGKTVRMIIGYGAGGVIDTYTRMIARYIPKHIPGNPTVIVENRPGAGSLIAANTVYTAEPKDGTVVGSFTLGLLLQQITGTLGAEFAADKFQWLGAAYADRSTCLVRSSVAQNFSELVGGKELATGTLGQGSSDHQFPVSLNALVGTNFKLVAGYPTLAQARLAFDNGEIDAYCPSFSAVVALDRERLEGPTPALRVLAVTGENPPDHPYLRGVPNALDFSKTPEQRTLQRILSVPLAFQPPYAMAPEVPRDRFLAMRQAFAQALVDPEAVADAERLNLLLTPRSGQEIETAVRDIVSMPQSLRDELKPIL